MKQFKMNEKCVLLLVICNIIVVNSQIFNYITIKIYRDEKPVTVILADTINNEENATEIMIEDELIPNLKSGSFQGLLKLKYLFIQRSGIESIEPYAFDDLPSLRKINLNFNCIKTITENTFANLTIRKLTLKGNGIRKLENRAFYNLTLLHTLDLSSNNLENLPSELFLKTNNLKVLDLSWNQLKSNLGLPSKHVYTYFEEPFWNINQHEDSLIDLSFNQIDHITECMFQGLTGIKQINLNYNNITYIHEKGLNGLSFLDVIELEGNNLVTLEDYILKIFRMVKDINLANNPWNSGFVCKYKQWCYIFEKNNTIDEKCIYTN